MITVHRRDLLSGFAVAAGGLIAPKIALAQASTPTVTPPTDLTLVGADKAQSLEERLLSAVVRISYVTGNQQYFGTGFLLRFVGTDAKSIICLITNRHVYDDAKFGSITLNGLKPNGRPDYLDHRSISLAPMAGQWILHPASYPSDLVKDIDLAILPLSYFYVPNGIESRIDIEAFGEENIPSQAQIDDLDVVESVFLPGFPGIFWDDVNNVATFRRGITASSPSLDFKGAKKLLLDAPVWPGSSGSPVTILDSQHTDRQGGTVIGGRLMLLGVIQATIQWTQDGFVATDPGPVVSKAQISGYSHTPVPDGLGLAIKASCLLDFKPLLAAKGLLNL